MKRFFCLTALIAFCIGVGKAWYWSKDGFSLSRLEGWNQSIPGTWWDKEADAAFQQPFYYLSRGRQSFAFLSADGNYVVKLPRADRFRLPLWPRVFSWKILDEYRSFLREDQDRREAFLLESFRICFDELKDLTAVIGMNLSTNGPKGNTLTIVDRLGRHYRLSLAETYFILQHRKQIFRDVFREAVAKEGEKGAEKVIDTLLALVIERAKKGVLNKDGSFLRNFAYDTERAYQIDVGSFYHIETFTPEEAYLKSIEWSLGPVREWIEKENPDWLTMLDRKLAVIYETGLH